MVVTATQKLWRIVSMLTIPQTREDRQVFCAEITE